MTTVDMTVLVGRTREALPQDSDGDYQPYVVPQAEVDQVPLV